MNERHAIDYDRLCQSILEINENIQSVSVINNHGRPIEKKIQDGTSLQITEQKVEMFFMQCVLTISMGRDFDDDFGEIGYVHVDRKNLSMFSFPLFDHIILVTSKAVVGPISLARKITSIIKKYKSSQHASQRDNLLSEPQKSMIEISQV